MNLKSLYLYLLCCMRRPFPLYSVLSTIRRFDETLV